MFDKRLLELVPEARKFIVFSVLGKWVALLAYVVIIGALALFLEDLATGRFGELEIAQWALVSLAALVVRFFSEMGAQYAGSKAASLGKTRIRADVYDKLVSLGPSYKEQVSTAQAAQICGEGVEKLEVYLGQYLPQLFYAVIAPLTLFALFLFLDAAAAVVLLVCVPLIPVSIVLIMKIAKRVMGAYWDSYVDLGQTFLESISALTTLKLFQADERKQSEMEQRSEGFRQATMRLLRMQLNSVTVMDLFTFGAAAVGIVLALVHLQAGVITLSIALMVVLLSIEFFLPMRVLGSFFHTAMGAAPVLDQVFDLLDLEDPHKGTIDIDTEDIRIECRGVSYAFAEKYALRDANFVVEENTFVGITGESGSGKSTLTGILDGELLGYQGSILVNGVELRDVSAHSLHAAITHVSASSYIFKGTVRTNLLVANREAGDYELWRVLGQCHLDDFILEQGGLDMPIEAGGENLSGGQRQRLAVARALLRDTPVYLFDEATSNVDADSEREILACIQRLSLEKTVIMVSHRLAAIAWADNILVLDQGRIVQQGTHGELAATPGRYAELWAQQQRMEALAQKAEQVRAAHSKADTEADVSVPEGMARALEKMPPTIAAATRSVMKGARIRSLVQGGSGSAPLGHPAGIPLPSSSKNDEKPSAKQEGSLENEPKNRSVFGVVSGLLSLCSELGGMVAWSTLFGGLGYLASIAMLAIGASALIGVASDSFTWNTGVAMALILACGVVRGFLRYGERLISHDQTFRVLALIRARVFAHMRKLAPARLESRDAGDLISLLTGDIELLEVFYAHTISPVLVAFAVSLIVVVGIGFLSVPLALAAVAVFCVTGIALPAFLSKLNTSLGYRLKEKTVGFGSFMYESLAGLSETLRYGAEDLRRDELGGRMGALAANESKLARRSSFSDAFADALITLCCLMFAGGAFCLASSGALQGPAAAACVVILLVSFDPVIAVARLGSSLHQTIACGDRVLSFLDEQPETPEVVKGIRPDAFTGAKVDKVTFSYGGETILDEFSVCIEEGAILHVAGPSGAGKSTFLKLLMRVWDAQKGSVQVSGAEVRDIQTNALRNLEGSMTQKTHLFSGTIRENIVFVRPDATEDQLARAVDQASLSSLIRRLPEGLDTPLGEIGEGLSEGERQRIGLARIFLYDAPFLLLDEPTSNLDCLNEAAVLSSLQEARAGKTMVMVSHRMSAAAFADRTLVVNQGRLS